MSSIYNDIYRSTSPLSAVDGGRRIYAPVAYPLVRTLQCVPIVHSEALSIAAWFPICWRQSTDGVTLVALRSLRADGTGHLPGSTSRAADLPLLLRAYPFVAWTGDTASQPPPEDPLIEDATADRTTDIGAPILLPNGRPGRGAALRLHAAEQFRSAIRETAEITSYIEANDLFERWPLEFKFDPNPIAIHDLLIIRQDSFGSRKIAQMLSQLGACAAALLGAHRLSLFRAGGLVRAIKPSSVSQSAVN